MQLRLNIAMIAIGLLFCGACKHHCKRSCNPSSSRLMAPKILRPETIPPTDIPAYPSNPPTTSKSTPEILLPTTPNSNAPAPMSNPSKVRLLSPQIIEEDGVRAKETPREEANRKPLPPNPNLFPKQEQAFPLGIAEYQQVSEQLAVGYRPDLEGLTWLADQGYRSAIFLRDATEDDSTDRNQFLKRSVLFRSIVLQEDTLDVNSLRDIVRTLDTRDPTKTFLYDVDGKKTPILLYAKFRMVDNLDRASAMAKANRYGSKPIEDSRLFQTVDRLLP